MSAENIFFARVAALVIRPTLFFAHSKKTANKVNLRALPINVAIQLVKHTCFPTFSEILQLSDKKLCSFYVF